MCNQNFSPIIKVKAFCYDWGKKAKKRCIVIEIWMCFYAIQIDEAFTFVKNIYVSLRFSTFFRCWHLILKLLCIKRIFAQIFFHDPILYQQWQTSICFCHPKQNSCCHGNLRPSSASKRIFFRETQFQTILEKMSDIHLPAYALTLVN